MKSVFKLLALLLIGIAPAVQAGTLRLTPNQSVTLGEQVVVDAVASGFDDGSAPSIASYDLDVSYDMNQLALGSVSFGNGLDVLSLGSVTDFGVTAPGTLNVFELSLDSENDLNTLQPGAFTLFTLTFNTIGTGTSSLAIAIRSIADAAGGALAVDELQPATVNVTAVPLPAAAWLLLSGAGTALGLTRRRRTSNRGGAPAKPLA